MNRGLERGHFPAVGTVGLQREVPGNETAAIKGLTPTPKLLSSRFEVGLPMKGRSS
jgi:hypothetical protein